MSNSCQTLLRVQPTAAYTNAFDAFDLANTQINGWHHLYGSLSKILTSSAGLKLIFVLLILVNVKCLPFAWYVSTLLPTLLHT